MKIPKEELLDIIDSEDVIRDRIVDNGRWTIRHEMIFNHHAKVYRVFYDVGATEQQEQYPFDYEPDEIECDEMHQVEKVVKVWEKVQSNIKQKES